MFHAWQTQGVFLDAYRRALRTYAKLNNTCFYCVDSTYVRNRHCQQGTGRNHTDRGRKALKLSV